MKKIILALLIFLSVTLFATDISYSAALDVGFPIGDFKDFSNPGVGISAKGHYQFMENVQITGSAGYTYFFGKDVESFNSKWDYNYSMIPLLGGINWFALPNQPNFYLGGELGITFVIISIEYDGPHSNYLKNDDSETEAEFTFAPSVGYLLDIGDRKLDLNLGIRIVSGDLNYINLKLSYPF